MPREYILGMQQYNVTFKIFFLREGELGTCKVSPIDAYFSNVL